MSAGGTVRVEGSDVVIRVAPGETLFAAAGRLGYRWPTICGGNAECNRCFVEVVDGRGLEPMGSDERAGLDRVRWLGTGPVEGERLACRLLVSGEAVVRKRGVRRRRAPAPG